MNDNLLEASKAFIGILILLAVGTLLYFSFENVETRKLTNGDENGLVIKHLFKDGLHTAVGTVNLPTPCHTLHTEVTVAESFPEQVTIQLSSDSGSDLCAQVITEQTFLASFSASVGASIYARLNGETVPLEIIEVSTEKELEAF